MTNSSFISNLEVSSTGSSEYITHKRNHSGELFKSNTVCFTDSLQMYFNKKGINVF